MNSYTLMHRLDPSGVLNVPLKVFTDELYFKMCCKTIKDLQKIDITLMCDRLFLMLANIDNEKSSTLTIPSMPNNFQCKKYTFVLISRIFTGIILIHKESMKMYSHKTKITKRKKRKNPNSIKEAINQPQCIEPTQNQEINLFIENQVLSTSVDNNLNNLDDILESDIISFQSNQNIITNLDEEKNNDQILGQKQLQMYIENVSSLNSSTDQSLKRKRSRKSPKRNFKKRPIELSNKVLVNRMKMLEGLMSLNRPFECMATKYLNGPMNHLPLRHATDRNKFNVPFAAVTLNMELKETKGEVLNNEITMNSFKSITEQLNNSNISNICIYQQCTNNSLPHLGLLPLAEEYSTYNSLMWRNTINEINKKLENSLEDILISKNDQNKWEEIKETMKERMTQCLINHETLISPELSSIDLPEPQIVFPSFHQINEFLNDNTMIRTNNFTETYIQNINKPVQVYHRQSIDIMEMISVVLKQSSVRSLCFKFTDLCPIRITNRRRTIIVMKDLLGLYQQGIIKLSQPQNTTEPSSITIQLNMK